MKVKAVRMGFYEHKRRREGEVFFIKNAKDFSDANREHLPGWMVKVSDEGDDLDAELDAKPVKKASRANQSVI